MRDLIDYKPFISLTESLKLLIVGRKLKKDLMVDIISEILGAIPFSHLFNQYK